MLNPALAVTFKVDPSWDADTQQLVDRANEGWLALEDMFRRLVREKQQR